MGTTRQAIIICGGLGRRLGSLVKDTPKPMLPIRGRPVLNHTIEALKDNGIERVVLAAGYKGEVVERHFARTDWGLDVRVSVEAEPLGTAGPLTLLRDELDDRFLVLYGDEFLDFDVRRMLAAHESGRALGTLLTRPSTHPWDADLIQTAPDGRVSEIVTVHDPARRYQNLGNASVYALSRGILNFIPDGRPSDFMKDVFPAVLGAGAPLATHQLRAHEYVKDLGRPERFAQVEAYLEQRDAVRQARSHRGPVTTVFLDRDGVINREVDLLRRPEQLEILPGVADALKLFNRQQIRSVIVTNQPVIARGLCDVTTLQAIHRTLTEQLGERGARVDAIYYCPHHPETHYGEGIPELRRACDCRKPGIGMFMQARRDLNIDLGESVMIGDSGTDIEAGTNAGIRTVLVGRGRGMREETPAPDLACDTLLDAARAIVEARL